MELSLTQRIRRAIGVAPAHEAYGERGWPELNFGPSMPEVLPQEVEQIVVGAGALERAVNYQPDNTALFSHLMGSSRMFNSGVNDPDGPSLDFQRKAFRGLIHRCSTIRANSFAEAMTTSCVVREKGQREYEEVEPDHAWVRLLRRPNPEYSALQLWEWVQRAKDITWNGAFLFIEFEGNFNRPKWLHPVTPAHGKVKPVPNERGTGIKEFVYFPIGGLEPVRVPREAVVWIRHVAPFSFYESVSILEATQYEALMHEYMSQYRIASLKDGAVPPLYLSVDGEFTQQQLDRWGEEFALRFMGMGVTKNPLGQLPVFGNKGELKSPMPNAQEIDYSNSMTGNATMILDGWGIPEGMVHDKANRANAESARFTYVQNTAMPEARRNCDQLTIDLRRAYSVTARANGMTEDGLDLLNIQPGDLTPDDPEEERKNWAFELTNGISAIDEYRKAKGKPEWGGAAAKPRVSLGTVALDMADADFEELEPEPVATE